MVKIINGGRQKPSKICPKCLGNISKGDKLDRCTCHE